MRLYTRLGATIVRHPEFGEYVVDADGAVDVPEALGRRMHATHFDGRLAWEDDAERAARLAADEDARRKDPATLLAAVEALTATVATQPAVKARKPRR